jgi:hypothetical protein
MSRISINGVTIDPLAKPRSRPAGARGLADREPAADASSSNYVLIQTANPLTADQRSELAGLGASIQEYVPDDTYLARYSPADLSPVRALPYVRWAGVYDPAFKVGPSLNPDRRIAGVSPSRKPRVVDVVLHSDVDPNAVRKELAAAAKVDPRGLQAGKSKVRLTVQEGQLEAIAGLDEVHHIEPVPERQLFNNVARQILHAEVTINGTQYQGAGEVVAVADTGLDKGSTTNVHPAFAGRVKKLYALGRTHPARTDDPHGHGTHVAGSVLGDGNSATMGGPIQGTAPAASLVLQSTLDSAGGLGGLPVDLHDLFTPPYDDDGARVHTNSWGATTPGLPYDSSAQEIDDMVWNHPDLVITFAAGNDGTDKNRNGAADPSSIGSQSAAKNCITVGACESERPDFEPGYGEYWPSDFPAEPLKSDRQADNPDGMVAFSSRGPTQEGRLKPDVVAPGTCILSTLSRAVVNPSSDFGVSTDPAFFFDSGTSMATPLVAGCAAVLRETLVRNGTPKPSAALIKALLIEGAVNLPGQYKPTEAGRSPNNNSGWGRVDLAGSVIIAGPEGGSGFGEGGPLEQGQEETIEIEIAKPSGGNVPASRSGVTLKVTLVWSDPPGAALQNDLDLIVIAGGHERHGNVGTRKGFDRANNVEQVVWRNIPFGPAKIVVRAFRITQFAQPYAYAWRVF